MGVLLGEGKYQVLENLASKPGYSASICIDVETKNNYRPLLFNTYTEPAHINYFLPLFHGISPGDCGEFHSVIPADRRIMAVFSYHHGVPLAEKLETLEGKDYPARARLVGSFLDAALVFDMLPPVFAVSALTPPYTVFDPKEDAVRFNFLIEPDMDPPEQTESKKRSLFISYIEKAFVKDRYLPESAGDFLEKMRDADVSKFVPVCAAWREVSAKAMEEYNQYLKESYFGYLKRRIRKKFDEKRKKRRI